MIEYDLEPDRVKVTAKRREQYFGRTGAIVKRDVREGQPYLGLLFDGVAHVVWFYASELDYSRE
jgi:hypothetical protein